MPRSFRRFAPAALVLAATLLAAPGAAQAGVLVSGATDCASQSASPVFSPWLDPANYVLAPGGAAESADGWDLAGATVVSGNEPWNVVDAQDHKSLSVSAGDAPTTGSMCVGIEYPTLRFFARSSGTGLLSSLRADVLFEDSLGNVHSAPVGYVSPSGSWAPTLPMVVSASLLPLLPGERTAVAFRFVPQGPGSWQIDDVHVDPWRTR